MALIERKNMAERKIILNLAVSLDGYICDPEGGFAWISGQRRPSAGHCSSYDIEAFASQVDVIVMGRKACERLWSGLCRRAAKPNNSGSPPQAAGFRAASPVDQRESGRFGVGAEKTAGQGYLAVRRKWAKWIHLFEPTLSTNTSSGLFRFCWGRAGRYFYMKASHRSALHLEQFWIDDGDVGDAPSTPR